MTGVYTIDLLYRTYPETDLYRHQGKLYHGFFAPLSQENYQSVFEDRYSRDIRDSTSPASQRSVLILPA